jgi:protein-tyrosine phosphatase
VQTDANALPKSTENSEARNVAQPAASSDETPLNATDDYLSQHIPTIEQRDALAARVYGACRAAGYEEWLQLLDLAPLASQHHLSGYNCIKFGQEGSPYAYLPLTLQQPEQAHELREKQKINESRALEWLAEKRKAQRERPSSPSGTVRKAPRLDLDDKGTAQANKICRCRQEANAEESTNVCSCGPLTNEAVLSAEWEAPLEAGPRHGQQPQPTPTAASVKTSTTHPISISPIIPPELLHDISTYVQQGIPSTLSGGLRARPSIGGTPLLNLFDSQTTDEQHHQLQLDGMRLIRCRVSHVDLSEIALRAEQELISATHNQYRPRTLALHTPQAAYLPVDVVRQAIIANASDPSMIAALAADHRIYCETRCDPYPTNPEDELKKADNTDGAFVIGNLLLSSCPGKKVRLTGPVRGRGAICRDLGLDLLRIRQLGVSAIVCCLDDEELKFLGASWSQYEREADKLGIEVVRLPMAEGFCPTDVIATDKAISCVVNDYTLRGVHVLVHCRGGVGRAGLIACMWLLKLGLVRSDVDEMRSRLPIEVLAELEGRTTDHLGNADPLFPSTDIHNNRDTMQTIHRLIETIRRRRSPKAIETAEQVCFLVKVSSRTRSSSRFSSSSSSSSSFSI